MANIGVEWLWSFAKRPEPKRERTTRSRIRQTIVERTRRATWLVDSIDRTEVALLATACPT
jgi:hypothetical protein